MNAYKVTGTSRQVGAIGIFEPFTEYVTANNQYDARLQATISQFKRGRERLCDLIIERIPLWVNEYVIQEYTGAPYGWEDSTTEETRRDAIKQLKLYRENSGTPSRLITRKVRNPLLGD